nr:putative 3-deoxy-d-manno-octulosonic acid transferase, mitochondrial [Quercus suber]
MAATEAAGKLAYRIYRAVSYGAEPVVNLHLRWRRLRGREHSLRWTERLGLPSLSRPTGPLLWFHAVSLGEGITAIPIIKECMKQRPDVNVLMTTTTVSALEVISKRLPSGVIYQLKQFAPLDTPSAVGAFLDYWKPNAIILIESELWPNLIMGASENGVTVEEFDASEGELRSIQDLKLQLAHRQVWMASSIHRGEEEIMLGVHRVLTEMHPDIVTILVPRDPQHALEIAQELQKAGQNVALRSRQENLKPGTNIYVVDTLGELRYLYRLTPIAVVGGSFFSGLAGHNIFEAAAAGCAVLTGCHVGHFSHMVLEMQRLNPLSVMQVSGKLELEKALKELFSDAKVLEARRMAAKQAFRALSTELQAWELKRHWIMKKSLMYRAWFSRRQSLLYFSFPDCCSCISSMLIFLQFLEEVV